MAGVVVVVGGGGARVDVKFFTFAREGSYQKQASANKGEGVQNFDHFVRK